MSSHRLLRDDLMLTFIYLYYHLFGIRWSNTVLDGLNWKYINLIMKTTTINVTYNFMYVFVFVKLKNLLWREISLCCGTRHISIERNK